VAKHARLRIRGIPVLYTPYINFPIDDRRKSGFLVPSIGSSDDNGFELITPYYWNIAPNLDATFYPRYMSKRGADARRRVPLSDAAGQGHDHRRGHTLGRLV
jgi:LPS-assembly protein